VVLALGISFLATVVGLDRDRAFYPTLMSVIASYYGRSLMVADVLPDVRPRGSGVSLVASGFFEDIGQA
jgi:hypothetical protein